MPTEDDARIQDFRALLYTRAKAWCPVETPVWTQNLGGKHLALENPDYPGFSVVIRVAATEQSMTLVVRHEQHIILRFANVLPDEPALCLETRKLLETIRVLFYQLDALRIHRDYKATARALTYTCPGIVIPARARGVRAALQRYCMVESGPTAYARRVLDVINLPIVTAQYDCVLLSIPNVSGFLELRSLDEESVSVYAYGIHNNKEVPICSPLRFPLLGDQSGRIARVTAFVRGVSDLPGVHDPVKHVADLDQALCRGASSTLWAYHAREIEAWHSSL